MAAVFHLINFGSSCGDTKNYLGCLDTMLILIEQLCYKPQADPSGRGSYRLLVWWFWMIKEEQSAELVTL